MNDTEKEFYTLKDVAERCGTSYGIVKRDIDKGVLPAYRVGRKYFIAKDEMERYVTDAVNKWGMEGYTIQEIMSRIPLSYAFVMELIKSGKLHAVKVGRQYVIPKGEFEEFMAQKKMH
ncbi:MAG: excisionase family DNA-binding protein [Firmicutes bacterium]|nr:excisionase family DNA-binding protein [Bacillota bacterium]MBQ6811327.1 excisionase family DNA-binding protein [Bacillota bacterium]